MSDSQSYLDIVIFAMIAVFIGLRLRSVLGRRNSEQEQPPRPPQDGGGPVIDLAARRVPAADERSRPQDPLAQIGAADPAFDPQQFLSGAQWAFETIVKAFAAGDKQALRPLLSDQVFADFSAAIDQRGGGRDEHGAELLRIVSATFDEAKLDGRQAEIAVRFVSEQRSPSGEEVRMIDLWRFARDVSSKDPNWRLVATGTTDH
jgi:predicted lipid-binding transport protein (Tim44 family)